MEFDFNDVNSMNNNKIMDIFKNDSITDEIKSTIVNDYYERINKLPNDLFTKVLPFITKPNILLEKYQNKLNTLSYEELVSLIYDENFDQDCLLTVVKLDIFQQYLNIEKENNKNDKLQTFYLSSKLFLSDNDNDLVDIINEISNILNSKNNYSEEFMSFIEMFLLEISNKINDIGEKVINSCLSILSKTISNNMLLTREMLKFYTLYRLKELDLFDLCNDVIISEKNNEGADYNYNKKYITINYNNIKNHLLEIENSENNISIINQNFLFTVSHELSHIIDRKKIQNIYSSPIEDFFSHYYFKNRILYSHIGFNKYDENHHLFIDENRADLFAILDINTIMNTIFKGAFNFNSLQNFNQLAASRIISMYTEEINNQLFVKSPSEKFDEFANNIKGIRFKESFEIPIEDDIYKNLLLGAPIPLEILIKILDIAKGNVVTNNLSRKILNEIEIYNNEKSDITTK